MTNKMWGNAYRATVVCVDRYDGRIPEGRVYNPASPEGRPFRGLMEFFQVVEELLDEMNFPQAFAAVRTFREGSSPVLEMAPGGESDQTGRLGTFTVRILFRQNASWQGSVTWQERSREERFRSALELVMLMDSALTEPS